MHLDASGRKVGEFAASSAGEALRNPNDGHTDGRGGVFFTDAGIFAQGAPATGKVFHLAADGSLRKVLDGVQYANGIAVDFAKQAAAGVGASGAQGLAVRPRATTSPSPTAASFST